MTVFQATSFVCPCGMCQPPWDALAKLVTRMNQVQGDVNHLMSEQSLPEVDLRVTSAYRCPAYNAKLGGAPGSQHLQGTAVDIFAADPSLKYAIVDAACVWNATFVEVCPLHIHLDWRDGPKKLVIGVDK